MKHPHPHPDPEPVDPKELRRQYVARFGSLTLPEARGASPDELALALAACASAGLPEPIITVEDVVPPPPELPRTVEVYTFAHFRYPQVQIRATLDEVAAYPERIIQLAKNAGIRADSLPLTDDPPIAA